MKRTLCVWITVACWLALPAAAPAQNGAFSLKAGDTVVFYGDSITAQNLYNQWIELYTVTRFPSMRVHFYGAGVGGDRVSGGVGGPIDQRLSRDVFAHKPTVVTVMLGMNDGAYRPGSPEIESVYTKGYEHLIESIHAHAPGARITLLGPSPFDDVTRPLQFAGGYNAVMERYAADDRELARKFGCAYVNLNPPVVATLERAGALDPLVGRLLLPDRVHPEALVHWVMAETLLKGWNAPALVSSVTMDGHAVQLLSAENAAVENLEPLKNGLQWTETDRALPLAFNRKNENDALLLELTDVQQALNQELLRVTGLPPGQYQLAIDDKPVAAFSAADLDHGINLAGYPTPMWQQAQRVGWLVRDRDQTHYVHMQMQIKKMDPGDKDGKPDALDAFENFVEDAIYEEAAPKAHLFTLTPTGAEP